jgi:3-oxoadipate enol-lactonase
MGGMIGQAFALKYPGIFKSMVLADTAATRPPNAEQMWRERRRIAEERGMEALVESTLERWFTEPFRQVHKDVTERIARDIRSTPVVGYVGATQAIENIDYLDRLKEIAFPTLVVVGEHDHGTPPEMAQQIHENVPASELVLISSAAHLSNIEQEETFNHALLSFLDRSGAARAAAHAI